MKAEHTYEGTFAAPPAEICTATSTKHCACFLFRCALRVDAKRRKMKKRLKRVRDFGVPSAQVNQESGVQSGSVRSGRGVNGQCKEQ